MKSRKPMAWRLISVAVACGTLCVVALDGATTRIGSMRALAQEAPAPADDDYESLAAGAVHEAFAEPVVFDPEPGDVVNKEPPAPIEELPPETQPEGDNVVWIAGYWNWDEDRDNFVWLSGFWRDVPPGREWVPGYWTKAVDGWQWVAGYWASTEDEEVDYLPNPPATLETGPATPSPSTDHTWIPGCWMWRDVRYVWRPGYWVVARPNWIWVPAHYVWTPGGFVFVNGYWDLPVDRRGMLFAPVFFRNPIYTRPAYRYSPTVVVNLSLFTSHLWVRPSWGCYYFGDYYAAKYSNRGFYPWHTFHSGHHGYDPIFVQNYHQHVHVEKNRDWMNHLQRDYRGHVDNIDTRPSRSFSTLAIAGAGGAVAGTSMKNMGFVTSLKQASTATDLPMKLHKIDDGKRQEFVKQSKETHVYSLEREKQEKIAGEGRPVATRKGRPDRTGDGEKVVGKGPLPKLEGPKVVAGKDAGTPGAKLTGEKPGEKPGDGKPSGDTTVRKMGRPRSPVGDKADKTVAAKREVPPRLDRPDAEPSTGVKKPLSKIDAPGRDKIGGGDKPKTSSGLDSPKTKPRDLPRNETPKPELPKTNPRIETPKKGETPRKVETPKFEKPTTKPKGESPGGGKPSTQPKLTPKFDPPRNPSKGASKPETPPATKPRSGAGGNTQPPRNDPPKKGRNDKKDRNTSASTFDGNAAGPIRQASREFNSQPAARIVRPEPRAEARVESNAGRAGANGSRVDNRSGNRNENTGNGNDQTDDRRRDRRRP